MKAKRQSKRLKKFIKWCRWVLAFSIFVLGGIISRGTDSWSLLGQVLFSLPLICQFFTPTIVRISGLWLGLFLFLQSTLTTILPDLYAYKALPPFTDQVITVSGDGIRGIAGPQRFFTDEKGFRTFPPVNYSKKDKLRIFAIGASTTEELFIDQQKTWTYLLQEKLAKQINRPVEVINTGLSGLRARNHLATFKKILEYEPDLLIFLTGANDWLHHIYIGIENRNDDELDREQLIYFKNSLLVNAVKALAARSGFMKNNSISTKRILETEGEFYTERRNSLNRSSKFEFKPEKVHESYSSYLRKIADLCDLLKIKCVFATQPNAYKAEATDEMKGRFWMTPAWMSYTLTFDSMVHLAKLYNDFTRQIAAEYKIILCDLDKEIPPTLDYLFDEIHFNLKGSATVADRFLKCLTTTSHNVL